MPATPKYLTVAAFIARLGDEADQLAGTGLRGTRTIDEDLLAGQLVHADGVIDGYVRARYPRVFVVVPEVLSGIAHDIARWRLFARGGQQTAMNAEVTKQFDQAMLLLRDIASGKLTLDVEGDGSAPAPGTIAETVSGYMPPSRISSALEGY